MQKESECSYPETRYDTKKIWCDIPIIIQQINWFYQSHNNVYVRGWESETERSPLVKNETESNFFTYINKNQTNQFIFKCLSISKATWILLQKLQPKHPLPLFWTLQQNHSLTQLWKQQQNHQLSLLRKQQ